MPHQTNVSLAISYLSQATDQLFSEDHDPTAEALFAGVECLEIQSQLSECDQDTAPVVPAVSPTEALSLAGDLLSRDGRAELVLLDHRLRRLALEVR